MSEFEERQLNFRQTVLRGQGARITQSFFQAGKITQVMFHFPSGCAGLVDMALSKNAEPFYPLQGFLALDDATPVHYIESEYYAREPLTLEIRNRDAGNDHTPTCTVTIRFKKPSWW